MIKLSPKQSSVTNLLILLVIVDICLLGGWIGMGSWLTGQMAARGQLVESITADQTKVDRVLVLRRQLANTSAERSELLNSFADPKEVGQVLEKLSQLATSTGVDYKLDQAETSSSGLALNFHGSGSLTDLRRFLGVIENFSYQTRVDQVQLVAGKDDWVANVKFLIYYLPTAHATI